VASWPCGSPCSGWPCVSRGGAPATPNMTKQEIRDALEFLQRVFVGPTDVDRLEAAIKALKTELARRNKK